MTPSAVVFDVGGVLTTNPMDEFTKVDDEYGLVPGTARDFFRGGSIFAGCERGTLPLVDFYDACVADILARQGITVPPARLDTMFTACMGEATRPEVRALVTEIKDAGHRTALLTNIVAERREWLHAIFPPGVIDVVCDSSEVGMRKPDAEIYEKLLEMLDLPAAEVAFVDDFPENVEAARALGIQVVQFVTPEQTRAELAELGVRISAVAEGDAVREGVA